MLTPKLKTVITKIPSWMKVLLAACFGLVIALAASSPNHATNLLPHTNGLAAISNQQLQAAVAKLPLSFEANLGQTDNSVKFLSRGSGYSLFLTPTEAVLALSTAQGKSKTISHGPAVKPQSTPNTSPTVLRMQLVDSNQHSQVTGLEPLPGQVNYFLGNDPKHWHTNIPTYAKVQYQQVYPGVDLVYYGNPQQLEYDFVVAPGADPNTIKLAFQGADQLEVNAQGDVVLHTAGGQVKLHKPLIYQKVDGKRLAIKSDYVLKDQHQLSFLVGNYDPGKILTIDPVLAYSTYLGGSDFTGAGGIAVDGFGNAYVTGSTTSTNFPTNNPLQPTFGGGDEDAFVAKLNPSGSALIYSTYLGGSAEDLGGTIAVDVKGNAYVTGTTLSTNFPTKNPLQPTFGGGFDVFVAKLNRSGSALVYSTYLGGGSFDVGNGIAVNAKDNVYVTGGTSSPNFPIKNPLQPTYGGGQDAFVAKLNRSGSALIYSTYLGGSNLESSRGIALDAKDNAYITGGTSSTNFPTKNPLQPALDGGTFSSDAFVAQLNSSGSDLIYSTYLGGSAGETGYSIAIDAKGNAYITGNTLSTNFPTKNPLQPAFGGGTFTGDAFVAQLNSSGSDLIYSTYLGGSNDDSSQGIAIDAKDNTYITGNTSSTNFPTKNPLQPAFGGGRDDVFVAKLNRLGSALIYSTYLGGSNSGFSSEGGNAIDVDLKGNAYIIGFTSSSNFPTKNPLQPTLAGSSNAFVTKISKQAQPSMVGEPQQDNQQGNQQDNQQGNQQEDQQDE